MGQVSGASAGCQRGNCWARLSLSVVLLAGLWLCALVVDPFCLKEFRDEKEAIFLWIGGLAGLLLVPLVYSGSLPKGAKCSLLPLFPMIVLAAWRLVESVTIPVAPGVVESGLPAKTDFLLRIISPYAAVIILFLAASVVGASRKILRLLGLGLALLLLVEITGLILEWGGQISGKEWLPFVPGAQISSGQTGLKTRFIGSFGNSNFLASYLAIILLPALAFLSASRGRGIQVLVAAVGIPAVGIILLCRSKGSLLALLIGLFAIALAGRLKAGQGSGDRWKQGVLFKFVVILLVGILLGIGLIGTVSKGSGYTAYFDNWIESARLRGESSSQRVLLAYTGLQMWEEKPFLGIGPGGYRLQFLDRLSSLCQDHQGEDFRSRVAKLKSFRPVHIHNDFLEILIEWGLLGFACLAGFLSVVLAHSLSLLRHCRGAERWIRLGLLGGIATSLAYGLLEFPFHLASHGPTLAILFGLALSDIKKIKTNQVRQGFWRRISWATAAGGIALVSCFLLWQGTARILGSRLVEDANYLAFGTAADQREALAAFKKAQHLDPGSGEIGLLFARGQWRLSGKTREALVTLRRTAPISDDPLARILQGQILMEEKRYSEAHEQIAPLIAMGSYLPGVGYLEGGLIAETGGNLEGAIKAYKRDESACLRRSVHPRGGLHPDLPDLYLKLGGVLERLGRYGEALESYRDYVDTLGVGGSTSPIGLMRIGRIYRDRFQDYTSAERSFEEALAAAKEHGTPSEVANVRKEIVKLKRIYQTLKDRARRKERPQGEAVGGDG